MIDTETSPLEMVHLLQTFEEKISLEKDLHPSNYSENDVSLLYTIAHKHYLNGNYSQAETFFIRLVVARSTDILYWRALSSCYQMQKKYESSLISWGMCAVLDNKDPSYHLYAADSLIHLNEVDQAKKALDYVASLINKDHPLFEKYEKVKNLINRGE
jgi:type III secretion system low calcium response chaperone LcrH/SycD